MPLNPNILICQLRGVKIKPLFYIKILLINPMLLAPVLTRILSISLLTILLKIVVDGYTIVPKVRVRDI